MSHAQNGLYRHLGVEDSTVGGVADNRYDVAFLHIFVTDNEVVSDGNLLESLLIHEDAAFLILVEVLIVAVLDDHVFQLFTNVVAALQHATVGDVLHLDVHDGVSLTGLTVLEVNANPNGTVHANGGSLLNVL